MGRYVIVGNGVAGVAAAQTIVRADPAAEVHIFSAESYPYYRRPRLWKFIAGEIEQGALYLLSSRPKSQRRIWSCPAVPPTPARSLLPHSESPGRS